jgi:hypothetical protein
MYYQYGYFKPLAVRKIGAVMTARQLVPATFVMSLILTAFLALWSSAMAVLFGIIVTAYGALNFTVAFCAAFERGVRCGLWSVVVFPLIHISYGMGYLNGLLDFMIIRKGEHSDPFSLPLSR